MAAEPVFTADARSLEPEQQRVLRDAEVVEWCNAAGLSARPAVHLPGQPLTVSVWSADRIAAFAALPGTRASSPEIAP